MDTLSQAEILAKRVRSLTIAVCCLAFANTLVLVSLLISAAVIPRPGAPGSHLESAVQPFQSWEGLSFEDRVERATLVLIAENRTEGGMIRAYIKEELRRKPGTAFEFSVGAEYPPIARTPEPNTSYGEGVLLLFAGSPAELQESVSIHGGNVSVSGRKRGELRNLSVSEVRRIVADTK